MKIVLLHGASGNAATFEPVLHAWSDTVALDLPGRGSTPGPASDTVAGTAAWLSRTLVERGLERPVLVGHSYGGAVALQLALDRPERIAGLVLVSSASRLGVHPSILEAVAASTPQQPYRLDAAFGPGTAPAVIEAYARASALTPPATALADWQACNGFDVRERLGTLRVPTLIVHGSEDALTLPRHQVSLATRIGAERFVVEGAGHMLPWERPELVAQAAVSFRDRLQQRDQLAL